MPSVVLNKHRIHNNMSSSIRTCSFCLAHLQKFLFQIPVISVHLLDIAGFARSRPISDLPAWRHCYGVAATPYCLYNQVFQPDKTTLTPPQRNTPSSTSKTRHPIHANTATTCRKPAATLAPHAGSPSTKPSTKSRHTAASSLSSKPHGRHCIPPRQHRQPRSYLR